ncbi:Glu/Leu/Phe/Val family dehydrogenase [Novosphingobium sp. 9]|uniref:Glu/Leu/Phe/Val family dehydrogenase n=1 Tax=Novosphingobium sp. 9 TaxID=2025349 RepID=UPI0021B46885|nr:Glu/Leu/Phe/Val dehydrogenase dimerization domain-containing protein [Novosphingobium sp. 9]
MVLTSRPTQVPEELHLIDRPELGLKGVIALHSTSLGPAAGGCRFWTYASHEAMVEDAMRLARGMSFKNAMAGLPFGGGKAVLARPSGDFDRTAVFHAFGEAVEALEGRYVTAEDVGTTIPDMVAIRERTRNVAGLHAEPGSAGGDPSPFTARGVFESLRDLSQTFLSLDLSKARVAVQGTGNVGGYLCRMLREAGAEVIVTDIDEARAARLAAEIGATTCAPDEILFADADVLAPCALGAILDETSIPKLQARLVCGGANNQLATAEDGEALKARGILFAPDYIVNAGGIINVSAEFLGETPAQVAERVGLIAPRVVSVVRRAQETGEAINVVADRMAQDVIDKARLIPA